MKKPETFSNLKQKNLKLETFSNLKQKKPET